RGRASLTVNVRPWSCAPLRLAMASSPPSDISTKAKPRDRPVSRSDTTSADVTVPCWPNTSRRPSAVVLKGRFPTYSFLLMVILSGPLRSRQRLRKSQPSKMARKEEQTRLPRHVQSTDRGLPDRLRGGRTYSGLRSWRTARRNSERDHQA